MKYRKVTILVLASALAVAASLALFATIQNSSLYVTAVRGQFYTPVLNTPSLLERITDKSNLMLLRFALWPCLIFLALECGSGYAISRLFQVEGSVRRLRSGFVVSLGITAVCLAVVWASFARTVH